MSAGRRRAEAPTRERRPGTARGVVVLVLGMLLAAAAWFFLVRAAIDFGQIARDGRSAAWAVCGGATLGAALCLLLVFVLGARIRARMVDDRPAYVPRRSAGRRRG